MIFKKISVYLFMLVALTVTFTCCNQKALEVDLPSHESSLEVDILFKELQEKHLNFQNSIRQVFVANELDGQAFVELLNSEDEVVFNDLTRAIDLEVQLQELQELAEEIVTKYPNEIPIVEYTEPTNEEIELTINNIISGNALNYRCSLQYSCLIGAYLGATICRLSSDVNRTVCFIAARFGYGLCVDHYCN